MPSSSDAYAHLAGHALPGGRVELTPHVAWLWAACMTAEPSRSLGHPSTGWLMAMKGCGLPLDELFALVDASADSGVVLGEAEMEFRRPLRVGTVYDVSARVLDVVRKAGQRSGAFDRLRLRMELRESADDAMAFAVVNTMIFPRGA